jgi:hypothetical protein
LAEQTAQLVARVLATAAVEELRDHHVGQPEGVIQLAVSEQTAVRGDLGAVEFELDSAVENGPQRPLFGLARHVPTTAPLAPQQRHDCNSKIGDNVTSHSTHPGNPG